MRLTGAQGKALHWKAMLPTGTTDPCFLDIVGDVHGCLDELLELMAALGYRVERLADDYAVVPPPGRKLAFVGDLVNRGPATAEVLRLAMSMAAAGQAFCVAGNHDEKLLRALTGQDAERAPDLARSVEQLDGEPDGFRAQAVEFLRGLPAYLLFDSGRLAIAHAGIKDPAGILEWTQGSFSAEARAFALHGEASGEVDESAAPRRPQWAADYRGKALVVYGHTPLAEPLWLNNTAAIDTGCVYGGRLTALRYPERATVSVPARAIYSRSRRPFQVNASLAAQTEKA